MSQLANFNYIIIITIDFLCSCHAVCKFDITARLHTFKINDS